MERTASRGPVDRGPERQMSNYQFPITNAGMNRALEITQYIE